MTATQTYITALQVEYASGIAAEHAYRPALKAYLESFGDKVLAVNDPKRQTCGAPDYIIRKGEIDVGYVEAKDVGIDLDKNEKSDQMKRYLASLDNLILTDYLEFRFYREGQKVATVRIAEADGKKFNPLPDSFGELETLLANFIEYTGQTIKSAKTLAQMMARKAQLMRSVFEKALVFDKEKESSLHDQLRAFQAILIHDMDESQFADVYAQTIAYGLFTARLHDQTLQDFSRQEARDLIPRSNPFLRRLFDYVCGAELDHRVVWIVDALCEVYRAANVHDILHDFGKQSGRNDPIVHFYETFLAEYDPKLRKARGVWYTPEPVVNFIVRAVDEVLQTHFGLADGLADTSKVTIEVDGADVDKRTKSGKAKQKLDVHKVQLLDVAAGTGTFTAEAIKQIYQRFIGQEGMWNQYVEEHLFPRLHGFEILMASYAMCHLKIDLLLKELGYQPSNPQSPPRLSVYLTNSLEEYHPDEDAPLLAFMRELAVEGLQATRIKKDMPIMVAYGNPPYSVSSQNKGEWIEGLMRDYKSGLNERNINSLSDDYIKFIRYAEHQIIKTGEGIIAMITNNSYLDGIVHRQMRKNLIENFDHIYILNLHGSAKRSASLSDGISDQNVFDIQQGVSISILIKNGIGKNKKADIWYKDYYGSRQSKHERLWESGVFDGYNKLKCEKPYFYFVPKTFEGKKEYDLGFFIEKLFLDKGLGIKFRKDSLLVKGFHNPGDVVKMLEDMQSLEKDVLLKKYNFKETKDWEVENQRVNFSNFQQSDIQKVQYKTFDYRYTYYPLQKISKIIPRGDSRRNLMSNMLGGKNYALLALRNTRLDTAAKFFISDCLTNKDAVSSLDNCHCFPLYLYPDTDEAQPSLDTAAAAGSNRRPNLDESIVAEINEKLGLPFISDHEEKDASDQSRFSPLDLLDYIYAVLHSPSYRDAYKEFLKIDFPRIPYPEDAALFWQLVALGGELRALHLLEHPALATPITSFPESGDCVVDTIGKNSFREVKDGKGKLFINKTQYFAGVPEVAWNFYIGGYQPAQKWLKDRKGRTLSFDDIRHYQKIIVALVNTDRLMKEIDEAWKP